MPLRAVPAGSGINGRSFYNKEMVLETNNKHRNSFAIDKATWRDLNAIRHLEKVCFPLDAWPVWDIISVLTLPNVIRLKALVGEEIVGFVAGDVRPTERVAWIATIGVMPDYRERGIGAALLEACEALLPVRRVKLCVRLTNEGAIRLYERFGYEQVSIWPRYYQNGEDALVMEKQLNHQESGI